VDGRHIVTGRRTGPDANGDTILNKALRGTPVMHSKRKLDVSDAEPVASSDKRQRTPDRDLSAENVHG